MPSISSICLLRGASCVVLGAAVAATSLRAQTQSAITAAPTTSDESTVVLDPFDVRSDKSDSYNALNSNAIGRFNTDLNHTPISADIMDQAFMNDINSTTGLEGLITGFSPGAGYNPGSDPGSSAANNQPGDRNGNAYMTLRGLNSPTMQRDGFMINGSFLNPGSTSVGFSSSFDVERVEIINGPQSMLYGVGGGGGVINTVSKQARFEQPSSGFLSYQLDQYGHKQMTGDWGVGTDKYAFRFDWIQGDQGSRRVFTGGPIEGYYGQFAFKVGKNTTVRILSENTTYTRITSYNTATLVDGNNGTTQGPSDSRNGLYLRYLLATNQIAVSNTGNLTTGAGVIDNGNLNWQNVDELGGQLNHETTLNRYSTMNIDTRFNSWLTGEGSVGYDQYNDIKVSQNYGNLLAPNFYQNPVPGNWTFEMNNGAADGVAVQEPSLTKGGRYMLVAENDLFHDKAHSQTSLGIDYIRGDQAQVTYAYFLADSNFNPITTGPITQNAGKYGLGTYTAGVINPEPGQALSGTATFLPWTVNNGPVKNPIGLFPGMNNQFVYNGQNYVFALQNTKGTAPVSASNPEGIISTFGNALYVQQKVVQQGIFGTNYTSWLNKKLDTIIGFRIQRSDEETYQTGTTPYLGNALHKLNVQAGADYEVFPWLHPYIEFSESQNPPFVQATDPYGNSAKSSQAYGGEAGFKATNAAGTISGTVAFFATKSKNEEYLITSTFQKYINPAGLNGTFSVPNTWINTDRQSQGLQAVLTASPSKNWRVRLGAAMIDGTVGTTTAYNQLYNDSFYENASGGVTYQDGTPVYVNGTTATKTPVASSAPGAVPLTVAMMSNYASPYFANPASITYAINSSSTVASILKTSDPVHGPILTGQTGLPITALQISPAQVVASEAAGGVTNLPLAPVGSIETTHAGDKTTGYPKFSMNMTDVYTISEGFLKGLRIGETLNMGWQVRQFYYFPSGTASILATAQGANQRQLFLFPTQFQVGGILGWSRKFKQFTFDTQLNVTNMFNNYEVVLLPNVVTGFTTPIGVNATLSGNPRAYVWSSTVRF